MTILWCMLFIPQLMSDTPKTENLTEKIPLALRPVSKWTTTVAKTSNNLKTLCQQRPSKPDYSVTQILHIVVPGLVVRASAAIPVQLLDWTRIAIGISTMRTKLSVSTHPIWYIIHIHILLVYLPNMNYDNNYASAIIIAVGWPF